MSPPIRLVGRRVTLRSTEMNDREALNVIRMTSEVSAYWRGSDLDAEFGESLADDETTQLTILTDAQTIVGLIQFSEEEDPDYRHASIDIYVSPLVHRQGVATDAIQTLLRHLIDDRGHHRFTIDPSVDNKAAISCYQSIGFRPVGTLRSYERRADGTWNDGLLMDLLVSDLDKFGA